MTTSCISCSGSVQLHEVRPIASAGWRPLRLTGLKLSDDGPPEVFFEDFETKEHCFCNRSVTAGSAALLDSECHVESSKTVVAPDSQAVLIARGEEERVRGEAEERFWRPLPL
jgi:hypothetical protein